MVSSPQTTTTVLNLQEKAGWMTLRTKDGTEAPIKMYVILKNHMLLSYSNTSSAMPNSVIFLEGCYIEIIETEGTSIGFGLEITHQFGGFKEVSMWCNSEEERNEWLQKLVQAAKTRKIEDYYEFKEKIGTGKFSDVYTAVEMNSNLQWAVKVVEKKKLNEAEREMMRSEVAIMRLLNHNNVVQMKEVFEDKQKMDLITELVEGGELFDRIHSKKVLSEYTSFYIIRQLLDAVKYLHDVGIVHRDIKPENILLTDDSEIPTIKLADFGLSKLVGPTDMLRTTCGTLAYVAPEVLMQRPYGKAVDIWSIGVVAYLMLRGRLPFDSKDRHILIQKTIEADLDLTGPYWDKFTPYSLDFLRKTMDKNTERRLTVDQALNHAWIRNGDVIIPRKINKHTMEEELLRKTLTSAKMQSSIYSENPKAMTLEAPNSDAPGPRVIYTTPDIYEDMQVTRRPGEQSLAIHLA
jgi:serine/threonine protein kinase